MNGYDRGTAISGIVFALLGVLFLLDRLGAFTIRTRFIWPLLLIGLGISIIARSGRHGR